MSELEKAKIVMKDILDYTVKICEENNLTYWLDCGTLLGAVRHGGFIPWDDDIDIVMPREDFEKFAKKWERFMFLSLPFKKNQTKGLKRKLSYLKRQILKIEWGILKYILVKNRNKGSKDIITYDWKMADYQAKFKYDDIFPLTKINFEGTEYNAPKDIDLYLKTIYGDYMQLPPEEERVWHNQEGFEFDEEHLKKILKKGEVR